MRRFAVTLAALLCASGAAADTLDDARALHARLADEAQCPAALNEGKTLAAATGFSALSVEARALFLNALASCAWRQSDGPGAVAAIRAADALGADWSDFMGVQTGVRFEDDALALNSFRDLQPGALRQLPLRIIWGVLRAASDVDPSGARALNVHEALSLANYKPEDGITDSGLRMAHARLLLRFNLVDAARERLRTISTPGLLMEIRITRLFDPLRTDPAFEARLDLAAAAESDIVRERAEAAAAPRRLGETLDYVRALRMLGREAEALEALNAVLAPAQGPDGASLFDDHRDQLNWAINEKAYILYGMHRAEEARETFRQAIAALERGSPNVSQTINFASRLQAEGRPREALDVLATLRDASSYGDMWAAAVRACAAEQLGDAALRTEALAFLAEHENDNPAARTNALLCVNDVDGAAALYIRRLSDEQHQASALKALQIYTIVGERDLAREPELRARLNQVRARADVRAAVDAVGRIEEIPLHSTYWGDF